MVLPTNWDQYGVADILRMLSGNNDSRNWDQVTSWRNMAILCDHHAARLRSAAAVLSHHWSPAKNPVAREFMTYVDDDREFDGGPLLRQREATRGA